jgi:beta-lactamase superfamily II metal-dependent hydrolase
MWRTSDGVTLTFIGPSLPFIGGKNAINDNSIAFLLQYRSFRMLFTGDAGVAAEQRFLAEGIDLHADVLKVGHHGSAYSSSPEFIAAVHPDYAIVSVGRHNLFGHPAPSTIQTLQRIGSTVYRTDENGAVVVTIRQPTPSQVRHLAVEATTVTSVGGDESGVHADSTYETH